MALRSSRSLGLEIAGTRAVVVELNPRTDPPGIRRAVTAEVPVSGVEAAVRKLLAEHRIAPRDIRLVLSDPAAVHRLLLLPPMTAAERHLFLERELTRELGGKLLLGDIVVRQVEGPPRKEEALVAAMPGEEAPQLLSGLVAAGVPPDLVTTSALALARAAEVLSPDSFERPTAVAHWGFRGLTILVMNDGAVKFIRELPHLAVPGVDAGDWFITEFQRSVRQYMQTVKGGAVGTVLIGSSDRRFEEALGAVEPRLGLPIVNLNEALRMLLPDGVDETEVPPGAFMLPFGAAMLPATATADLLPFSIVARRRLKLLVRGAAAAAALVVVSVGYLRWDAGREAATYRKAVARATAQNQMRLADEAQMERIKQERQAQYERIRLLKSDPLGLPPYAEVFKEISRVAPAELRLERITLKREVSGPALRLAGTVESTDLAQAQAEFNRFYLGLQGSPLLSEVIFSPPPSAKATIQQGPSTVIEGRSARDVQTRAELERQREAVIGSGRELAFELELRLRGVE